MYIVLTMEHGMNATPNLHCELRREDGAVEKRKREMN